MENEKIKVDHDSGTITIGEDKRPAVTINRAFRQRALSKLTHAERRKYLANETFSRAVTGKIPSTVASLRESFCYRTGRDDKKIDANAPGWKSFKKARAGK